MKIKLHFSTLLTVVAILFGISIASAQQMNSKTDLNVKSYQSGSATVTTLMDEYLFPYDLNSAGTQVAISSWGMGYSYFWSVGNELAEIAGTVKFIGENGLVSGTFVDPELGCEAGGIWNPETQEWISLGLNPDFPVWGDSYNDVWGMSKDGSKLVGLHIREDWTSSAFIWTAENGFDNIGLELENSSKATGISGNGEVIFGWIDEDYLWQPTIWKDGEYTILAPGEYGNPLCSSYEGDIVAGENDNGAFYWTEETGIVNFGEWGYMPTHVTSDGLIFGFIGVYPPDARVAFVYDIFNDQQLTFNEYAESKGMEDAAAWTFFSVNKVTHDGSKYIGAGVNPDGQQVSFMIEFPVPIVATLSLEADPVEGGSVMGEGEYEAGASATIEAIANENYEFVNWTNSNDEVVSTDAQTEIVIPEEDLTLTAHFESTIGLGEDNINRPVAYPNPAIDEITISNLSTDANIALFDLNGKTIKYTRSNTGSKSMNIDAVPAGVYILQIQTNEKTFNRKINIVK